MSRRDAIAFRLLFYQGTGVLFFSLQAIISWYHKLFCFQAAYTQFFVAQCLQNRAKAVDREFFKRGYGLHPQKN
jgi:hypothetical protein